MNTNRMAGILVALLAAAWWPSSARAQAVVAASAESMEVETRGPVHEAFAEPVVLNPEPGIIVAKAPPGAIEELPPDEKPDDSNVIWIPGYWSWDDDRNDFIWISGVWRITPPGYYWVPGYWTQTDKGYQWTPGFWTPAQTQEIEYLPPPPQTVEVGPSSPAPSADQIWNPGYWSWAQTRYVWRPGHWIRVRPEMVWVPARYIWTPRGVIFVPGRWDYVLDRRGVLFAPVYIPRVVVVRQTFHYTPTIVIRTPILTAHLFVRPRYTHYYFGDYYAPEYVRHGIHPWFELPAARKAYDPIFVHRQWEFRKEGPRWIDNLRVEYRRLQEHKDLRPVRTFRQQEVHVRKLPEPQRRTVVIARPLAEATRSREVTPFKFQRVNPTDRKTIITQGNNYRTFTVERSKWERPHVVVSPRPGTGKGVVPKPEPVKPQRVKIPSSLMFQRKPGETRRPGTEIRTPGPGSPSRPPAAQPPKKSDGRAR